MMKNFVEELRWRGMLHDMTPGTEAFLLSQPVAGYIGFDPTAPSLHIGNLATIMLLRHFQLCGHRPIALVGGATGMIGDPSGKTAERSFLSEQTLRDNQASIRKQLEKFLDFNAPQNPARIVNNYDWFKDITFLQFLREAGKFLTINYMTAKESVQKRLETGLSFTEFSYQLLQGYDFYHLYKHHHVRLQMGGSDQWGNITTGTELIRRKEGQPDDESHRAFALTTPLVTKADGTKFGKSESGNVWLDPALTSPYAFYQFWLNTADADAPRLIRVFTLLDRQQVEDLERRHAEAPHLRLLQRAIAQDVTTRVHGPEAYHTAVQASEVLFGKATLETLRQLDATTFSEVFAGVPTTTLPAAAYAATPTLTDLLSVGTQAEIYPSKGEARKAIAAGAVSVNKTKITDPAHPLGFERLQGQYLLIGKGRKNHLIRIV